MKRLLGLAVAATLAGCGSTVQLTGTQSAVTGLEQTAPVATSPGSTGNPGTSTVTGQPAVPDAPISAPTVQGPAATAGPTVSRPSIDRIISPIELGFMATNVGNAQQFGLNVGQTYSDKQAYQALVKEYNATGGLAGRRIIPFYGETDTASSDWNTQFQAACQHLSVDHHVKAVLGYVFVFLDSFEKCLSSKGIPHLYGGYQPGDVQAQRDFPSIVSVGHPTVDGVNETVLTGAMASGRLTTKTKLGILYDGCAPTAIVPSPGAPRPSCAGTASPTRPSTWSAREGPATSGLRPPR